MANPRQRRKQRSGTSKVTHSKKSVKNKHKVIVKGPEVLVKNWDRTLTVRQNYSKLGLMPTLNPRQAGGIEPVEILPFAVTSATAADLSDLEGFDDEESEVEEEEAEEAHVPTPTSTAGSAKLAKGFGRIERDENGKVVRIVYGGDNGSEISEEVKAIVRSEGDDESDSEDGEESDNEEKGGQNPWGNPMEEWSGEDGNIDLEDEELVEDTETRTTGQGIPIGAKRRRILAKTEIVKELEELSSRETKIIRHTSSLEADWLLELVAKYGDDVEKMARDRKLNVWQKTTGEINRALAKAGGLVKLKAEAAQRKTEA